MLRLVLSPRWMVWHVLTLGAMVTCGFLAAWQWERAGSAMGSVLNVGYGVQWPIFAVFFGVMWWRFLHLELQDLHTAEPEREAAEPEARPAAPPPPNPAAADPGPSPFRRSPHPPAAVTDADDPELAAYNRMLATLAERER